MKGRLGALFLALLIGCGDSDTSNETLSSAVALAAQKNYRPAVLDDQLVAVTPTGLHVIKRDAISADGVALDTPVATWTGVLPMFGPLVVNGGVHGALIVVPLSSAKGCELRAFNPTGDPIWTLGPLPGLCLAPGADDGTLLMATADGALVAIDGQSGDVLAENSAPTQLSASPALAGNRWVLGGTESLVVAHVNGSSLSIETIPTPGRTARHIAAAGTYVAATADVVGTDDHRILRAAFGDDGALTVAGEIEPPGPITTPLALAPPCDGTVASGGAHWWCGEGVIASGGAHWMGTWRVTDGQAWWIIEDSELGTPRGLTLGDDGRIRSGGAHWITGPAITTVDPIGAGNPVHTSEQLDEAAGASLTGLVHLCDGAMFAQTSGVSPGRLVRLPTVVAGVAAGSWADERGDAVRSGVASAEDCGAAASTAWAKACAGVEAVPLPDMPASRSFGCAAWAAGRVWVIGGVRADEVSPWAAPTVAEVVSLAPGEEVWRADGVAPHPRAGAACAAGAGRIWVAGGWDGQEHTATFDMLDPTTGQWRSAPDTPGAGAWSAAAGFRGAVVLGGGIQGGDVWLDRTVRWSPDAWQWDELGTLAPARYEVGLAVVDGALMAFGGDAYQSGNSVVFDDVQRLSGDAWAPAGTLPEPMTFIRPISRPGALRFVHGDTSSDVDPVTWTVTERAQLPPSFNTFSAAFTDTPAGLVLAGGGSWGPTRSTTVLVCAP